MSHCLVPRATHSRVTSLEDIAARLLDQMTHEGLYSPFVPLGAPKWCDMDYIYHAYIIFVQLNFCRHLNHTAHFWGNANHA